MPWQRRLIESGDISPSRFYRIDSAIHYKLFEAADREKMRDVIQDCQVYYTRSRILDTASTVRCQELCREHSGILRALREKDRAGLKTCVFDHLHENLHILASKIEGSSEHCWGGD